MNETTEEETKSPTTDTIKKYLRGNPSRNSEQIKAFFYQAIIQKDPVAIRCLVKNGVSLELPLDSLQVKPLHIAVITTEPDTVELLLELQADLKAVDANGTTALHCASRISSMLRKLLNPDEAVVDTKRKKVTAVQDGSLKILRLLIDRGCDVNAKDEKGFTPLHEIFNDPTIRFINAVKDAANSASKKKEVALIRITKSWVIDEIRSKQAEKLKFLLDHGADVETRYGESRDTILHVIIKDLEKSRNVDYLQKLYFVDESHERMIEDILNLKLIDANVKNGEGKTPMDLAVSVLSSGIVRVLVKHGGDLNSAKIERFVYPDIPPCLDAVENLIEIVQMRRRGGHPLSSDETLAVLNFFITFSFSIETTDSEADWKLRHILEFGTEDAVAETLIELIRTIHSLPRPMLYVNNVICKSHLSKMRAFGLRVNEAVEQQLEHIVLLVDNINIDKTSKLHEILGSAMKSLTLTAGKSLMDVLNLPLNEMYYFVKNSKCKEIVRENFKGSSGILEGFFARCLVRRFVEEIANDNLRLVLAAPLPDVCCEGITKYLTNRDLLNLYKAATIPLGGDNITNG